MTSIKTKFLVGLFVLIGLALSAVAIIWLGVYQRFEEGLHYVAYFDESVQGLDKDSPVKYRGVSIGRVESIGVAPDANLIRVVLKIETASKFNEKDMTAQLKSIGITGIMFVELERKKGDEHDLSPAISFTIKYPVIATRPSGIKQLMEGIDDVLNRFKELDVTGISDKFKLTLDKINRAVDNAQIKESSSDFRSTINKAKVILDTQRWLKFMGSLEKESESLFVLTEKTEKAMSRLDRILADNEKAGENVNRLIELLADQPSQLFFGEPLPSKVIEPDID